MEPSSDTVKPQKTPQESLGCREDHPHLLPLDCFVFQREEQQEELLLGTLLRAEWY